MNGRLVKKLVEDGEDLTLGQIVESTRYCCMDCNLFGDSPLWHLYFDHLTRAVDKKYPGQVSWKVPYVLKKFDNANGIVPRDIKAKYVRLLLYSQGKKLRFLDCS